MKEAVKSHLSQVCQLLASRRRLILGNYDSEDIASGLDSGGTDLSSRPWMQTYYPDSQRRRKCPQVNPPVRLNTARCTQDRIREWKAAFYRAVETDDLAEASRILTQQLPHLDQQLGIEETYVKLKQADKGELVFIAVLFVVSIGLIIGMNLLYMP